MIDHIVIVLYLAMILYIGFTSRRLAGFREFAISHGHYGWLVICCTLSASFIGGGFSTGNAAKVFSNGMVYPLALLGFSLQIILVALFVAPRIKSFPNAVSVGDIIEPAYGKKARIITGFFSMLICAGILGAQIGALGAIFNVFFGVSPIIGILIGCGIIFFYSTIGGMAAVVKTDILQFILLIIGIPLIFVFGISMCGGWQAFVAAIPESHLEILSERMPLWSFVSLFLVFVFGETLVPPYVQRLLLGRDAKATSKGNLLSGILSAPFFLISGALGLIALQLTPDISSNLALPAIIKVVLPIGLSGLVISGVISIVMSSADSFLNAASVALVQDVIKPLRREPLTDRQALNIARLTNLITGGVALLFAFMIPNVLDILIAAYDYWAPTVLVPLVAVLLGKKAIKASFYAAVVAGTTTTLIWDKLLGSPYGIQGFLMGTLLSLIAFVLVNTFSTNQKAQDDTLLPRRS
ncbi:MAG: sodium:solute symporter family protein [Smithellaceae bacterium]